MEDKASFLYWRLQSCCFFCPILLLCLETQSNCSRKRSLSPCVVQTCSLKRSSSRRNFWHSFATFNYNSLLPATPDRLEQFPKVNKLYQSVFNFALAANPLWCEEGAKPKMLPLQICVALDSEILHPNSMPVVHVCQQEVRDKNHPTHLGQSSYEGVFYSFISSSPLLFRVQFLVGSCQLKGNYTYIW